jgi:hypothetical protein
MNFLNNIFINDCKLNNVIETSFQVTLDDIEISWVGKNINQLIIRKEIESRESFSLFLHIVFQLLLATIKNLILIDQLL